MATKFSLKPNPTFKRDVEIPVPGEKPAKLNFVFRHKTRNELKEFVDSLADREDIDTVMDVACGWGIDESFDEDNVEVLLQNYPGSALAIINAYLNEVSGARKGN